MLETVPQLRPARMVGEGVGTETGVEARREAWKQGAVSGSTVMMEGVVGDGEEEEEGEGGEDEDL